MPNDGGNLIFTDEEKAAFLSEDPSSESLFRPLLSSKEFIHGENRWCFWLNGVSPQELEKHPRVMERVRRVQEYRLASKREATRRLASTPYLFGEIRQPSQGDYILIPRVSSENRRYVPMGFFDSTHVVGDTCLCIPGATLYHFGVLNSAMHMAWVRQIAGRLRKDFRYSNEVVYNNFPWPVNPRAVLVSDVEDCAREVLTVRQQFRGTSLATLYDPLLTPKPLIRAHERLDRAVERCYRTPPFKSDLSRLRVLFTLYAKLNPEVTTLDSFSYESFDEDPDEK
jgi:hypothetical protein